MLASVVYLAVQIRQNTASVRGSTFQASIDGWQTLILHLSQPEPASLLRQASQLLSDLPDEQIQQYWSIARVIFRRYENDFYQHSSDVFDESSWEGYRRSLANDILSQPGMRAMWKIQRENFGAEFRAFMDGEANSARSQPPTSWADEWRRALQEESAGAG